MLGFLSRDLVKYMNENILGLVSATFKAQHGLISDNVEVISIEIDGYYIKSGGKAYFLTFSKPCESFQDFKSELLTHVRNYRTFFV